MKVLSDDLHIWVEEGDDPPKITMQDSLDGRSRYLAIRLKVGDTNVVVNGELEHMMAWLAGTMQGVADAVNSDAQRTIAEAVSAADAVERGVA